MAAAPTPLQVRVIAARTFATSPSSEKPTPSKKLARTIPFPQKHDPQPTESEEDVAADRSRMDPIHRPNLTESQEDVMADRSSDDPLNVPPTACK
ncbi:hypothetical protein RAB80_017597 [Fusarium oxysporum f. sp. vasinfectum]|nr:hypothetical protein RAB80_017597 [Fusarium oxysporum f. sp. vasinfectum]KAK2922735.1 hypothetical protein FoTM2_017588 [Fusarium oxysporum f. sp. vasinfectum]